MDAKMVKYRVECGDPGCMAMHDWTVPANGKVPNGPCATCGGYAVIVSRADILHPTVVRWRREQAWKAGLHYDRLPPTTELVELR
jgi:hypothetical protein